MLFFFSSRRRHTRYIGDWSSDVCSSDLDSGDWRTNATAAGVYTRVLKSVGPGDIVVEHVASDQTAEALPGIIDRSEERRVGKEGRSRWWRYQQMDRGHEVGWRRVQLK